MKFMRKYFFLTMLFLLVSQLYSENLKAHLSYSRFYSPANGPYIETYLSIEGNSAYYVKNEEGKFQGTIEVTFIFSQGEEIKTFEKYNLLTPIAEDSASNKINFIDQQRIPLPNGEYDFEVMIRDVNSEAPPFSSVQKLSINFTDSLSISDVELIDSMRKTEEVTPLTKSGYEIIPYTSDFYPENFTQIAFYAEIYNANKAMGENEEFLINYFLESYDTGEIIEGYNGFEKDTAKEVNIVLKSFLIKNLPSGNYNLVIEAKNKTNDLLIQKKVFFQRSNTLENVLLTSDDYAKSFVNELSKPELEEYIKGCSPISSPVELSFARNQLKGGDEQLMKQYFFNFWLSRNEMKPEEEWLKYKDLLSIVEKKYSTHIKRGYESDRGRIFLKYGKPNARTDSKFEPVAYPYEIWHYYGIENRSNVKFIFYNPNPGTNDYPMLHSTLPGEINNPQWKVQLHSRTGQSSNRDELNNKEHWGGRSDEYFNNPR